MKRITLCADDFGQSVAISSGILQLVAAERVQAVSCMTESNIWPKMAYRLKALDPKQQIGLHFNLTHGFNRPNRRVTLLILRALLRQLDPCEIRRQFVQQWLAFEDHYGQAPEFVDGHQHVHALPIIRRIVIEETHQRNPRAWVRVPHSGGLMPKEVMLRTMTTGFSVDLKNAGIVSNARFAGFRRYCRNFDFARFFQHLLATVGDDTLVMCHPGKSADDPRDPIGGCRQEELDYLLSEQFTSDLAIAGFRLNH